MLKGVSESDISMNEMDLAYDESLTAVADILAAVRRAGQFEVKRFSPIARV
jgi:hypothetical protein